MSRPPNWDLMVSNMRWMSATLPISALITRGAAPRSLRRRAVSSAASSSAASFSLELIAILFTPCSASFSAIPRPIPRDAPVIRAVCCVSVIGMTPSRSRVRIDRIDLDLVYLHFARFHGKTRPRAAAGKVGGDDEFSDGRQSPILHAIESAAGGAFRPGFGLSGAVLALRKVFSPLVRVF